MGLISGLLTLPLAPVRATGWLAERIREQGEGELYDEAEIRRALDEVAEARDAGELDEATADEVERELLERLFESRRRAEEARNG